MTAAILFLMSILCSAMEFAAFSDDFYPRPISKVIWIWYI